MSPRSGKACASKTDVTKSGITSCTVLQLCNIEAGRNKYVSGSIRFTRLGECGWSKFEVTEIVLVSMSIVRFLIVFWGVVNCVDRMTDDRLLGRQTARNNARKAKFSSTRSGSVDEVAENACSGK